MANKGMTAAQLRRQANRQERATAKNTNRDHAQTHNTAARERTRR